jgi:hypothetical protein
MKDERNEPLDRLFQTVRTMKPDTAAAEEYFEMRLMARLEEKRCSRVAWSTWSWRLIPLFVLIVIIVGLSGVIFDPASSNDLFAGFTNGYEEYQATNLLAGG